MNYKGKKDQHHTCVQCGSLFPFKYYSNGEPKYCSMECQVDGRWEATKLKIEAGEDVYAPSQRRYLAESRGGYKCEMCATSEWMGEPLTLQVDHIDGNPGNNFPSNLRILCPNCHSQTPTYKGGNKKNIKQDARSTRNRLAYQKRREATASN